MIAPHEIISDEEIMRVHGHANFGDMSPREVVNDGVRKYAIGYTGGHTQLCILMEHGLITTPKPGKYSANLTKKGKRYAQAVSAAQQAVIEKARAEDADLLYSAWLGLRVLDNIAKVKKLSGAADVSALLLAEIEAAHPEFAPRSALRSPIAEGTKDMTHNTPAPVADKSQFWQWRSRIKGGAWDAWENGRYGQQAPPFMDVEERQLITLAEAQAMVAAAEEGEKP